MKTFVLILVMLTAQLAAQDKQTQETKSPQITVQPESEQASQTEAPSAVRQPQTVVKPTTKPVQQSPSQQLITFTAEQLNEYENKILDRAETFYNNRMTQILRTVGILVTISVIIIPLFVGVLLPLIQERHRRIRFEKELSTQSKEFNKILSQSEEALKKYTEEQTKKLEEKLTKQIYVPLSMAFSGLGGALIQQKLPGAYGLMLQAHVLSIGFNILSQCTGSCLPASYIIRLFTHRNIGNEIGIETLTAVDNAIEIMKENIQKIINDEKREDMKVQVRELQTYIHTLIYNKQHTTPPQTG